MKIELLDNSPHRINNNFGYTDTEQNFHENLKIKPANWLWRTKPVNYTLNKQGYRAPEWKDVDWNNSILVFGCSFVFGLGVDDKDTMAHKIYQSLFIRTVNLGIPGGSPMAMWVNSSILRKEDISPKAVIYLWPFPQRISILRPNKRMISIGGYIEEESLLIEKKHYFVHWVEFLRYSVYNTSKLWQCPVLHYHIDKDVCKNIPELKLIEPTYNTKKLFPDEARDYFVKNNIHTYHPGPKTHTKWSNIVLSDLEKYNIY